MITTGLILYSLSAASLTQSRSGLPNFDFQGWFAHRKVELTGSRIADADCKNISEDGVVCKNIFPVISNIRTKRSIVEINKGLLSRVYFSGQHDDFVKLNDLITAKYGAPCKSLKKKYENKTTDTLLSSLDQTWCFRTGKLRLTERAYFSDQFTFEYKDKLIARPRARRSGS